MTILSNSVVYLEPSQTSMMELSCKNSQQLKGVICFSQKSSIIDIRLGPKYASKVISYWDQNQNVFAFSGPREAKTFYKRVTGKILFLQNYESSISLR